MVSEEVSAYQRARYLGEHERPSAAFDSEIDRNRAGAESSYLASVSSVERGAGRVNPAVVSRGGEDADLSAGVDEELPTRFNIRDEQEGAVAGRRAVYRRPAWPFPWKLHGGEHCRALGPNLR